MDHLQKLRAPELLNTEKKTSFRGGPGPFHFTCREALAKSYLPFWLNPVCLLSGSGCGGESLMLPYCVLTYWMLVAVRSILKAGPHSA